MNNKSEYNKKYYDKEAPYPVRLGELKSKLQQEAFEKDASIHSVLKDIVHKHFETEEEIDIYDIGERAKRIKERLEAELSRIKNAGSRLIELHEKLLSCNGSDFINSFYNEIPGLKKDISSEAETIKKMIELKIEKFRKELLSHTGLDLISFSENGISSLKKEIDESLQPLRKKIKAETEKLRKELIEI